MRKKKIHNSGAASKRDGRLPTRLPLWSPSLRPPLRPPCAPLHSTLPLLGLMWLSGLAAAAVLLPLLGEHKYEHKHRLAVVVVVVVVAPFAFVYVGLRPILLSLLKVYELFCLQVRQRPRPATATAKPAATLRCVCVCGVSHFKCFSQHVWEGGWWSEKGQGGGGAGACEVAWWGRGHSTVESINGHCLLPDILSLASRHLAHCTPRGSWVTATQGSAMQKKIKIKKLRERKINK